MDDKLKEQVTKDLIRYEKTVEETDGHYDELEPYGRYPPDAPYGPKHLLPFRIGLLEAKGADCTAFRAEYERITRNLTALEERRGREYRTRLFETLRRDVDHYPVMISYFTYLEPFELEIPQQLAIRSAIEILSTELERDFDLADLKTKVAVLDEVFRCKYLWKVKKILEYYPEAETLHFPDRFWWRHPSKILEERQAMLAGS
ncbi:MAG: hypothetical protein M0P33_02690 [Massilibacteroides sp.]|nr:hypothetical protein [Massilibacteroides sp.]